MESERDKEQKKDSLRIWFLDTDKISVKDKRIIFSNWDKYSLKQLYSIREKYKWTEEIKEKKKKDKGSMSIIFSFFSFIYNFFTTSTIFKYLFIPILLITFWMIYSSPSWVKINWYPWEVWKIRKALSILEDKEPEFYKLVVENTDIINVDDMEIPMNKWAHAVEVGWNKTMRIFRPKDISISYLTSVLVHEACHLHQFKYNRFASESHQKLENECTYLWIYIIEDLFPSEIYEIEYFKKVAEENNWHWWDWWKDAWKWGDTTKWLSDLLPADKLEEYKFFWYNYDY